MWRYTYKLTVQGDSIHGCSIVHFTIPTTLIIPSIYHRQRGSVKSHLDRSRPLPICSMAIYIASDKITIWLSSCWSCLAVISPCEMHMELTFMAAKLLESGHNLNAVVELTAMNPESTVTFGFLYLGLLSR